jgi:hypothetical protein
LSSSRLWLIHFLSGSVAFLFAWTIGTTMESDVWRVHSLPQSIQCVVLITSAIVCILSFQKPWTKAETSYQNGQKWRFQMEIDFSPFSPTGVVPWYVLKFQLLLPEKSPITELRTSIKLIQMAVSQVANGLTNLQRTIWQLRLSGMTYVWIISTLPQIIYHPLISPCLTWAAAGVSWEIWMIKGTSCNHVDELDESRTNWSWWINGR